MMSHSAKKSRVLGRHFSIFLQSAGQDSRFREIRWTLFYLTSSCNVTVIQSPFMWESLIPSDLTGNNGIVKNPSKTPIQARIQASRFLEIRWTSFLSYILLQCNSY
ncbi:hypothetical protein AVEN_17282-1 [Araneus ventricosus]|uniref:Uncharacterized protein n=1 Tax=Araneus ventricosus TaxID=182803 RepID=A0A4Y2VGQ2_ARAVE|nr:hypothetical protein AVEN_17282-1 [Araneus ventricosus]